MQNWLALIGTFKNTNIKGRSACSGARAQARGQADAYQAGAWAHAWARAWGRAPEQAPRLTFNTNTYSQSNIQFWDSFQR